MKPEADPDGDAMTPDRDVVAMRALHDRASDLVDAAPDPAIRSAVLAAAARAVAARPHDASRTPRHATPFATRRWPLSAAALLVVSLLTGLVVNRALQDEPERITAASALPSPEPSTPSATALPAPPIDASVPVAVESGGAQPKRGVDTDVGFAAERGIAAKPARGATGKAAAASGAPTRAAASMRTVDPLARIAVAPPLQASAPAPTPPAAPRASAPTGGDRLAARPEPLADGAPASAGTPPPVNTLQRMRRGPEPTTPEAWVERIAVLRAAGNHEAADREVEALRARYPDYDIPPTAMRPTGTR